MVQVSPYGPDPKYNTSFGDVIVLSVAKRTRSMVQHFFENGSYLDSILVCDAVVAGEYISDAIWTKSKIQHLSCKARSYHSLMVCMTPQCIVFWIKSNIQQFIYFNVLSNHWSLIVCTLGRMKLRIP